MVLPSRLKPKSLPAHLPRLALALVLATHAMWSADYIRRTSRIENGERIFFLWDDAMVAMRYARNLAHGYGLVWNAGERVQGFSSLGQTLFMVAIHLLPVATGKLALLLQLVGELMLLGTLALTARIARMITRDPWLGAAGAAAVALYSPLSIWGLQGSELAALALLTVAGLAMATRRACEGTPWPRALLPTMAAGLLLRLDFAITFVPFAVWAWQEGSSGRKALRLGLTTFAAIGCALILFGWLYYGDPLPNTYYLKATGCPRSLMLPYGARQLRNLVDWKTALVLLAAFVGWMGTPRRLWIVGLGIPMMLAAYHVWTGGDWLPDYVSRFLVPGIPLLVVGSVRGIRRFVHAIGPSVTTTQRGVTRVATACAALVGGFAFHPDVAEHEWLGRADKTMLIDYNRINYGKGIWLRAHTAPSTVVAFHWAGMPAYWSERPGVDVLGKADRHIAKLSVNRFIPGHSKWDWLYVLEERRPDIILETSRGLGDMPRFRELYREAVADGTSIFVRRGSESLVHGAGLPRASVAR
jgi:hypothetical protein